MARPDFSRRMLREHLDQRHDHASRRLETLNAHVEWLFTTVLAGRPGSVLDLGCGPGLYTERLAERGCSCLGFDISPASIEYARHVAGEGNLDCTYVQADICEADLGSEHDLAMLLFGELNNFPRTAVPELLRRVRDALRPGGTLVVEVHTHESVVREGSSLQAGGHPRVGCSLPAPTSFFSSNSGSKRRRSPHLARSRSTPPTGQVETYSETLSAYNDDEYRALLDAAGFTRVEIHPTFGRTTHRDLMVITASAFGN